MKRQHGIAEIIHVREAGGSTFILLTNIDGEIIWSTSCEYIILDGREANYVEEQEEE